KAAVFTWYGCTLETRGWVESMYVSGDTPMKSFVNTHAQLEARRDKALQALQSGSPTATGPRVMVVGPTDSGKSTLSGILAAYAVRLGRCPTFVDLDVGQGQVTMPGVISAAALDSNSLSIEEGFSLTAPLVFFYGHTSLTENPELYKHLVERMADCINKRLATDVDASSSGVIFNTCGMVEGVGLDILAHAIGAFSVDIVLVMGNDKLYAHMVATLNTGPGGVTVVKVPRSNGVVQRDQKYRRAARARRAREYFYGAGGVGGGGGEGAGGGPMPSLSPTSLRLSFSDVS
ncbi:unnamed protein product, partial [Discosporangium mesarthrocarpum]